MKRILIFAAYFYPHVGGYENNVYELSRRLVQRDCEIDILTCNTEKVAAYEELDGIHVYRLPCWNVLNSTYPIPKPCLTSARIFRKLLRKKYDVVNTQTRFFATSFIGLIFAKVKRIPLVHTERGTSHSVVSSKVVGLISRTYDHTIGALIVKSAHRNIGVSEAACDFLKHLGASNTQLVHNGVDAAIFRKGDTNYRQRLGISTSTILITFLGRLIYAKGVQDLLSAFPKIKEAIPEAKLLIVGDGSYRSNLENLVCQNNGSTDILFLGQKGQDEVIDILSATDIFSNPSYSEGLPTSVMEAASTGLPIVATDVGGTREVIENGKTGLLIPCGDIQALSERICELIKNKVLRASLGEQARNFLERNYSWDRIVDQFETILNQVTRKRQNVAVLK